MFQILFKHIAQFQMRIIKPVLIFVFLTYTFVSYSQAPINDDFTNPIDVTSLINACSADAQFSTLNATPDLNAGSCWAFGPNANVWFRFTATATGTIQVNLDRGGIKGDLRFANMALWELDGITELACGTHKNVDDDISLYYSGLTAGSTYLISVDRNYTTTDDTFSLCLSDQATNDYFEGALNIDSFMNGCSANEAFSTLGGSADRNGGSCWPDVVGPGPYRNVWFEITAPATGTIEVKLDSGDSKGTIRTAMLALWAADGTTEIACNSYRIGYDYDDVSLLATGLTAGDRYYVTVDNTYVQTTDTFTLCLSDQPTNDYYEGATDVTALIGSCSVDEAFSTLGNTFDRGTGSCWPEIVTHNTWFSFVAPSTGRIQIDLDRGGAQGTLRHAYMALWSPDGNTELACTSYSDPEDDLRIRHWNLTPGTTYYFTVDNRYVTTTETFALCLDALIGTDTDEDGVEDAIDLDDDNDGIYDTVEGCEDTDISGTVGVGNAITNTTYAIMGTDITYSFSKTPTTNIYAYDTGLNGLGIRIEGQAGDIGNITSSYSTPIENVFFKLTDFDNQTQMTVEVYDENNILYDLENEGLVFLGSEITQTGNSFSASSANSNGDDPSDDVTGAIYFYFEQPVSNIVLNFNHISNSSTRFIQPTYCLTDFDVDGLKNHQDLDSDGDGIPDNVEGQTTLGYIVPNSDNANTYRSNQGVNSAYLGGIAPTNSDAVDYPDFLDLDADNQGDNDTVEAGLSLSANDIDNDGLDDAIDVNTSGYADPGGTIDHPLSAPVVLPDEDSDANTSGDVDFRDNIDDSADSDGDGIPDDIDLDDDNDGIPDIHEQGTLFECEETFLLDGPHTVNNQTTANVNTTASGITYDYSTTNGVLLDTSVNPAFTNAMGGSHPNEFLGANQTYIRVGILTDRNAGQQAVFTVNFPNPVKNPTILFSSLKDNAGSSLPSTYAIYYDLITPGATLDRLSGDSDFFATGNRVGATMLNSGVNGTGVVKFNGIFTELTFLVGHVTNSNNDGIINTSINLGYYDCVDTGYSIALDTDNDGIHNLFDLDSDNDGIYDVIEAGHGQAQSNGRLTGTVGTDGLPDAVRLSPDYSSIDYDIAESSNDSDIIPDFLDLDSDGDGIPDNVEAQTTLGYIHSNNDNASTYLANNGVNSAYLGGVAPTNTDGTDVPDYLDLNSDNEGGSDTTEARIVLDGVDVDNDGLDDETDANTSGYLDPGGTIDNPLTAPLQLSDIDGDANSGGDVDFRDATDDSPDNDNDGIVDSVDLDDDNDGILDTEEGCGNFIINGSFEHDNFTDATAYPNGFTSANGTFIGATYNTNTLTAWNYTQNLDGWLNSGSFGSGTFAPAVDGSQYIDIVGNNNVTGGVSNELTQDVTLVQGESYTFSFYWGEDIGHQSGETVAIEFDIIDSNNVAILDETLTTIATGEVGGFVGPKNWFYEERTFIATTDQITVRFSAQTFANEASGAVLDLVSLRYSASTVCADTDNDGVPDAFDLDSDNDGIYDAVESGHNQAYTNGQVDGLVGADGIPDAVQDNPDARSVNYSVAESGDDSDTIPNFLDLDADGDGIPDNVEAQTTIGYVAPNGTVNSDGVDTAYTSGLIPTNTDGSDNPDYLDLDSDNEGDNDTLETQINLLNIDSDNDGLDDAIDATADYTDVGGTIDNPLSGAIILLDTDKDATTGGDVDFRDTQDDRLDTDSDGIVDAIDLDDDNDGILDAEELHVIIGNTQPDCTGETILDFSAVPILESGTALQQGAVYRFSNVTAGTDVLLTIVETFNASVADIDNNTSVVHAFRPRTAFDISNVGKEGYIEYRMQFVTSGGVAPVMVPMFFMNINDTDGNVDYSEEIYVENPSSYIVSNPTELSVSYEYPWVVATGGVQEYPGADNTFPQINFGINYENKTEIRFRMGITTIVPAVANSGREHNIDFRCTTNYINPEIYVLDSDKDGVPNPIDLDVDNDGIFDVVEAGHNVNPNLGRLTGTVGADGVPDAVQNDPNSGNVNYTIAESIEDSDTIPNYVDLDADGDGIPDNVEAQTTIGYIAPNNLVDSNGIDTAYSLGIEPVNTDSADAPDYLDIDADNDGESDTLEAVIILSGNDLDLDGLDDATDQNTTGYPDVGGTIDNPLVAPVILPDIDADATTGGDVDFRDIPDAIVIDLDADDDGILDSFEDLNDDGDNDPATNPTNSDNDIYPDYLDIDSDNDGIPDNVEAQTTAGYIPPSLIDANDNGLDDAYENGTEIGLIPINTDNTDLPDYLDEDSDNDGILDNVEGNDHNADGIADVILIGSDKDNDGLDDNFEGVEQIDIDVNDEIDSPIDDLPNTDGDNESDYRDLDDDNDGIQTIDEDTNGDMNYTNDDWDADGTPDYLDEDQPVEVEDVEVFNVVTPNGDGAHDFLVITGLDIRTDNSIKIFNRWGIQVFTTEAYDTTNNRFEGFSQANTTYKEGELLPTGTYFYILNYVDVDGGSKMLSGHIYLN